MLFSDVKDDLVGRGLVLARPRDKWVMTGDFRLGDEITYCTFYYFVKDGDTWMSHAKKNVAKLFPDLKFRDGDGIPHWVGELKIGGGEIKVRIFYGIPPISLGFIQVWGAVSLDEKNHIRTLLSRKRSEWGEFYGWPEFGFAIAKDNGIYRADSKGDPVGASLVIPHARFLFLLLRGDSKMMELAKRWRWSV